MKTIITILPLLILLSCQGIGKSTTNDTTLDKVPTKISHYRYFDLSKMKGIEPYAGDSCVTVTEWDDSIRISVEKPINFTLTFKREKDLWHADGYYFMDQEWCKCDPPHSGPTHIDWIVRNDTLYKFNQAILDYPEVHTFSKLDIMTGNLRERFGGFFQDRGLTDLSNIYQIIDSIKRTDFILSHRDIWKSDYKITRTPTMVTFDNYKYIDSCYFPEIQIWGCSTE